jgi:hypothetical protein
MTIAIAVQYSTAMEKHAGAQTHSHDMIIQSAVTIRLKGETSRQ